jgi:hypothetical protein
MELKDKDKALMYLLRQQDYLDSLDTELDSMLTEIISSTEITGPTELTVTFKTGLILLIERRHDSYRLTFSDKTYYLNNETATSIMSLDRVKHYLRQTAEYVWREL